MAHDQYMYPMEQPGYQAPPMPSALQWLMNNQFVGPGSIPPSDFSIVEQGIPNALRNVGQIGQDYAQAGRGMAQRMQTMTPDYPLGQGFLPTPEAGPQFDPTMVTPGLSSFPPPPNPEPQVGPRGPIGPGGVGGDYFAQDPPLPPGSEFPLAPMGFGEPPPPPGNSFQPQGGLAGTGGLGPVPGPMDQWLTDYNRQTDEYIKAQQDQAKSAMWIQMGQSMLANMGSPELALAGMGQAVNQYGANEPAMEQYKQGRESERLDLLYKMEQIRRSQAGPHYKPTGPKKLKLADGTYAEDLGDGQYLYNDNVYDLAGLNEVALGTRERDVVLDDNAKRERARAAREQSILQTMSRYNMDREQAEEWVDRGYGVEGGKPTELRDVPDPEKRVLDAQRAQLMKDPDVAAVIRNFNDEQLAAFIRESEALGNE